jgi:Tfp pilus assembly protein PilF
MSGGKIMLRNRVLVKILALWIVTGAPLFGQTEPNTSGAGHDYFTAEQDGVKGYLENMTINHLDKVSGWIQQGRMDMAVLDLRYVLDRFPNQPRALQLLPVVASLSKNQALAFTYFEKAVNQFPQYAVTQAQYGLFLLSIGKVDEGIARFNQSIAQDPKSAAGHAGLAHAYAKKGNMEQARDAAKKARELGFNGKLPDGL